MGDVFTRVMRQVLVGGHNYLSENASQLVDPRGMACLRDTAFGRGCQLLVHPN